MKRSLRSLVRAIHGELLSGHPTEPFEHVSIDSRTLKPGEVFFAIKGPRFDGHDYLRAVADRGAAALVVQEFPTPLHFHRTRAPAIIRVSDTLRALQDLARSERMESAAVVIGITGSNGKTTTKEMLAAILNCVGPTLATRGNFNNQIGLPLTLCRLLPEHQFAIIEMGTSHPGDMELLVDVSRPQVGMITNVGKDHLEFFITSEGVLQENRLLYDRLPKEGIALINLGDPLLKPLAASLSGTVVTYGMDPAATVRAESIALSAGDVRFTLVLDGKKFDARLNSPSTLQVRNALAAAAAAYAMGIKADDIVAGLAAFRSASMRMQVIERHDGTLLINDAYNANPSSVQASVESFCLSYSDRPRWLVLGDMRELGPTARAEHEAMGRWLAYQPLERIFLYGRDTRFVQAGLIAEGVHPTVERFQKKRYLIEALQGLLVSKKPVLLFKASRCMRLEDVIDPLKGIPTTTASH